MTETGNTLPRVLFLCTHNAARSQLAETFLRHYASDRFEVLSAGHPTTSRRQGYLRAIDGLSFCTAGDGVTVHVGRYTNNGGLPG
jgi:Low molecular weight phosphotyrosine protein phosphatase